MHEPPAAHVCIVCMLPYYRVTLPANRIELRLQTAACSAARGLAGKLQQRQFVRHLVEHEGDGLPYRSLTLRNTSAACDSRGRCGTPAPDQEQCCCTCCCMAPAALPTAPTSSLTMPAGWQREKFLGLIRIADSTCGKPRSRHAQNTFHEFCRHGSSSSGLRQPKLHNTGL